MIRIYEVKLKIGTAEAELQNIITKKLKINESQLKSFNISGKSMDARNKKQIFVIYNVDIELDNNIDEEKFVSKQQKINKKLKIKVIRIDQYEPKIVTKKKLLDDVRRPIIVGFGPSGIFAGLLLAYNGMKPLIVERGKPVDERSKDVDSFWENGSFNQESNPLFGEGGAGTFSDGKLTTGKNDQRISFILNTFHDAGGPDEILYMKNPHIGTDILRGVVKNIRKKIIDLGGDILFNTKMIGMDLSGDKVQSVTVETDGVKKSFDCDKLILAIGHSARETYELLNRKSIKMEQKPFSIGVRVEHPQDLINESQYGEGFKKVYGMNISEAGLPAAEYKLSERCDNGRGVYTFCMCPGGQVITTSAEPETISVNGMSKQARADKMANSAILVDVKTEDYDTDEPLAGIDFQRKYEKKAFKAGGGNYFPPEETLDKFMGDESIIAECLPEFAAEGIRSKFPAFGNKIRGFDNKDTLIKGIESGSSSPVRIVRDSKYQSSVKNIYPCGEGAGYAGGITSSAIDGLKCAESIIEAIIK